MARTVSLVQLRTRVRQRADIENARDRFTDNELTDSLNESLSELYDLLVASYGQEYYRTSATISVVSQTNDYELPDDFYRVLSVDINLGGSQVLSARPYMEYERNRYKYIPAWTYGYPLYYRLHGSNGTYPNGSLSFLPAPTGSYTVTLNYVPTLAKLNEDTDTFDGINGWEEYAVLDAAIKCFQKEESDPSLLLAQKEALRQRIMGMAPSRDANGPEKVNDVEALSVLGWWT